MQMWQNSLLIISQLEQDLKNIQFKTAPQSMSFDLELKKRQEEFARNEANLLKELSILKIEARYLQINLINRLIFYLFYKYYSKKDEDLMASYLKQNELKLQIENLNVQLGQKVCIH
jgi:hypothetical protein